MSTTIRVVFLLLAWPTVLVAAPFVLAATVYEWWKARN